MKRLLFAIAIVIAVPTVAVASDDFDDVDTNRYFSAPVQWAVENDITTGKGPRTFAPFDEMTRAQGITFLYRYHQNVVEAETLAGLDCATGQVAVDNGDGWACGSQPSSSLDLNSSWQSFTDRVLVDDSNELGEVGDLALIDGLPVIAYLDDTDDALRVFVCENEDCSHGTDRTLVDDGDEHGGNPRVAISTSGTPLIVHRSNTAALGRQLSLYECDDATCSTGTNHALHDVAGVADELAIAIGADGIPVIAWNDGLNGTVEFFRCNDATCSDGGGTNTQLHDQGTDITGRYPEIEIGADDNPIILFTNGTANSLEVYACADPTCAAGTHRVVLDDDTIIYGIYTDMTLGDDGLPVIVSTLADPGTGQVGAMVYRCTTADCAAGGSEELYRVTDSVSPREIAIAPDGDPVALLMNDNERRWELFECDDPSCTDGSHTLLWEEDGFTNSLVRGGMVLADDGRMVFMWRRGDDAAVRLGTIRFAFTDVN